MVYVSGDKEMKTYCPVLSVMTVSTCDGDVADTLAPTIGTPVAESTTRP
jgi:hypothetical protein